MKLGSLWARWRKGDNRAKPEVKSPGYSRYTDPKIFPAFGGDALDPPPYATDRRSTGVTWPDRTRGEDKRSCVSTLSIGAPIST